MKHVICKDVITHRWFLVTADPVTWVLDPDRAKQFDSWDDAFQCVHDHQIGRLITEILPIDSGGSESSNLDAYDRAMRGV